MNFPCIKCGLCCRSIQGIPALSRYDDGTGVCRYLEQNSCSIYGVRPLICRVEAMYQTFFKTVMTEEQFIQANLTACQELAERFQDTNAVQKIRTIRESELEQQNMSILLPFYLLKLRKRVVAAKSSEQLRVLSGSLKVLVEALTQAIERSERRGSISAEDMKKVIELMGRLYNDLYKAYPEFKETNDMVDDILLTYSEEAALEARRDEKVHFAQYLIQEGWASEKIVEATKLDLGTVESLMGAAHA